MSRMEAIYGCYKVSDVNVNENEDLYDAGERLGLDLVEVDGVIYEIEVLEELDECGFSLHVPSSSENRFVALWYNGGAGMHEVVESIIRKENEKRSAG